MRKLQNSRAAMNPSGALLISTFAAWGSQIGLRANLGELYTKVPKTNLALASGDVAWAVT